MFTNMTMLTRTAFAAAMDEMLSINDAIRFLEEGLKTRSLRSILDKFANGMDEKSLRNLLVSGLKENHPEMKKDSVEKRVRGWMNPQNRHSLYKADAIEVALILGLPLPEADEFVTMISGEHLHWRSAKEIIYIYALQNGLRYPEAGALETRLEKYLDPKTVKEKSKEEIQDSDLTEHIRTQIEMIHSEEELRSFLTRESGRLGELHNQAYMLFSDMLDQLTTPVSEEEAEIRQGEKEHLTIRDILREYLFQNIVLEAMNRAVTSKKLVKKGELPKESQFILSRIQKDISDEWPEETTLSKMKSRKADVTRKTLILLFLATYSGEDTFAATMQEGYDVYSGDYSEDFPFPEDEELTREDVFLDTKDRIDFMLSLCGFAALDPRSSFDWLILYCMCAEDLLDMDDRMRNMFLQMFGDGSGDS